MKNKYTLKEILILSAAVGIVLISCLFQKNIDILTLIGSVTGIIYVILISKNSKYAFLYGIVNVFCLGISLFMQKIYAGAVYNLLYSIPMLTYGFFNWGKKENEKNSGIKTLSKKAKTILFISFIIVVLIYSYILKLFGGTFTLLDSISAVTGYIGIFLMTNKYLEQWIVWIFSNLINISLWTVLTINDINNIPILIMWGVYFINSVVGYTLWKKKL